MIKKINYILDRGQKIRLVILVIIILIGSLFELLGVSGILPLINAIIDPNILETSRTYGLFMDMLGIRGIKAFVIAASLILICVYIVKNIYIVFMLNLQYRYTLNNNRRLAMKLMECYLNQKYLFHVSHNVAELQRNVSSDVSKFFIAALYVLQLFSEAMVSLFLGLFLLITDVASTLIMVFIIVISILIFTIVYKRVQTELGKRDRIISAEMNKWIFQAFGGIKEIKAMGREKFFLDNYENTYFEYTRIQRKSRLINAIPTPFLETICIVGVLFAIMFRIYSGDNAQDFIPTLSVFALAAIRLLPSFNRMTGYISGIMYNKSSVDNVYQDLKEIEDLQNMNCNKQESRPVKLKKELKGDKVSFRYPNTDDYILKEANFIIPKNQSVAIIGPSGAGKTTIADIILGLLKPEAGHLWADSTDIYDNIEGWHKVVGYIPQDIYLMDDTIKANITFGINEDEIDDERVEAVVKEAQLGEVISALDDGVDTIIGERGVRLSGGQRQRIGIARALYHRPEVLILDEATSALDNETEEAVMNAINALHGNITLIIIAHRLSTIKNCDIIYRVNQGSICMVDYKEIFLV